MHLYLIMKIKFYDLLTFKTDFINDEYKGLFFQGQIANKCEFVNKVFDLGFYENPTNISYKTSFWVKNSLPKLGVYAILENVPISFTKFVTKIEDKSKKVNAIVQLLKACACIHERYVHLDLKPDNIQFDTSYNLRIIDFGYCEVINSTKKGIQGSSPYISPYYEKTDTFNKIDDYHAIGLIIIQIWYNIKDITVLIKPTSIHEDDYWVTIRKGIIKITKQKDKLKYYIGNVNIECLFKNTECNFQDLIDNFEKLLPVNQGGKKRTKSHRIKRNKSKTQKT